MSLYDHPRNLTLLIPLSFHPCSVSHVKFAFLSFLIVSAFLENHLLWPLDYCHPESQQAEYPACIAVTALMHGLANPVFLSDVVQLTIQMVTSLLSSEGYYSYTKTQIVALFGLGPFPCLGPWLLRHF